MTHIERKLNTLKTKNIDISQCGCTEGEIIEYLKFNKINNNLINLLIHDKTNFILVDRIYAINLLGKDSSSLNSFTIRYGLIEGNIRFINKNKKCSLSKDEYIDKFGKEKFLLDRGSNNHITNILKFGELVANERKSKYLEKWKISHSIDGYIQKYGEIEGKLKFDEKIKKYKFTNSIDGYIQKYGEIEGKLKFDERVKKIGYKNSLDYYISIYGSVEGPLIIKDIKNNSSLNSYITKYGKEEGTSKYNDKCNLLRNIAIDRTFHLHFGYGNYTSKIANQMFSETLNLLNIDDVVYTKDNEYSMYDKHSKRIYFYDFKYKNKIIEFNGDFWHANPLLYKADDLHKILKIKNSIIWESDSIKYNTAIHHNHEILIVWESEYINNKTNTITKILNFLNS